MIQFFAKLFMWFVYINTDAISSGWKHETRLRLSSKTRMMSPKGKQRERERERESMRDTIMKSKMRMKRN